AESTKRGFTSRELNTVQFQPPDPSNPEEPLRIQGKVAVVKKGYAFIESSGYPRFLCPGSKYGGIIMQPGLEITFEPAFTARGSVSHKPMVVDAKTNNGP